MRFGSFRVSPALDFYPLQDFINLAHLLVCQGDFLHVLLNSYIRSSSGNRDDDRKAVLATVLPDPRKSNLSKRGTLPLGDLLDFVRQLDVLMENVWLEAWLDAAKVAFGNVLEAADLAGL